MRRIGVVAWVVWIEMLRRKDVYVLFILLGALLLSLVSLNIFGLGSTSRYVLDVGLMMSWIFGWILAVYMTARELPREESRGTIFPLLARPVRRADVVIGKWLGAWSVTLTAMLLFYGLVAGVNAGLGGTLDARAFAQGYLLHAVALGILCAVALLFSTRMNHDAASALSFVLTGAAFVVVPRVPELLVHQKGAAGTALYALYHLVPHVQLFDLRKRIVHEFGAAPASTAAVVVLYGLVWIALLLLVAWLAYRRKRFSRTNLSA